MGTRNEYWTMAREWTMRLNMTGTDRYMNQETVSLLGNGFHDPGFQRMVMYTLIDKPADTQRLAMIATEDQTEPDPTHRILERSIHRMLTDPLWLPDPKRLTVIDLDLQELSKRDGVDKAEILGWRAWVSWLAGDRERARICVTGAEMSRRGSEAAHMVAWLLAHGIQPAGQATTPMSLYSIMNVEPVRASRTTVNV